MISKENAMMNNNDMWEQEGKWVFHGCSFMLSCYIELKDFLLYHVYRCSLAWRQNLYTSIQFLQGKDV